MLLFFTFPVFLKEANFPRYKTPVPTVICLDASVEILDIDREEAPIAFSISNESRTHPNSLPLRISDTVQTDRGSWTVDYRSFEGRLYRSANSDLRTLLKDEFRTPFEGAGKVRSLLDQFLREIEPYQDNLAPRNISKSISAPDEMTSSDLHKYLARCANLELSGDQLELVRNARAQFKEAYKSIIVINGEAWVERNEPLITVSTKTGEMGVFDGDFPDKAPILYTDTPQYPNSSVTMFPLTKLEEAKALSRVSVNKLQAALPYPSAGISVRLHKPELINGELPIGDTIRIIESLSQHFMMPADCRKEMESFLASDQSWNEEGVELLIESLLAKRVDSFVRAKLQDIYQRVVNRPISADYQIGMHSIGR